MPRKVKTKSKRNYKKRMFQNKVYCMKIAKKYGEQYWDGNRKFGYGGYKYIPGRWEEVAKKLIKTYKLNNNSKILDVGCGKAFLLFEIRKILPKIKIEVVIDKKNEEKVIKAIKNSANTGEIGDGKIFSQNIDKAIRIRTGEKGNKAI